MGGFKNSSNRYYYNASTPAAAIFAVLFGIVFAVHSVLGIRRKTMFMLAFVFALFLELLGYITRIISIKNPSPLGPFAFSQTVLVVAPAFMAASTYMIVGHLISFVGGEYSFINHEKITTIFVTADVVSILTQAAGAAILSTANGDIDKLHRSKDILLFGLILQVVVFAIFLFIAISVNWRSSKSTKLTPFAIELKRLQALWTAFYMTGILITIRSIYRVAEFASISFTPGQNPSGYLVTKEWPFYVFDAVPIILSAVVLAWYHPGGFLPAKKGLRIDGTFEETKAGRKYWCCGPRKERTAYAGGDVPMQAR